MIPANRQIVVLGDVMLDSYVEGEVGRISPEAPIPVLLADQHDVRLGGAAGVACFLRALGAEVLMAGVVGDDHDGRTLASLLREEGIGAVNPGTQEPDASALRLMVAEPGRPTTRKERFMGRAANRHPHQLLRVDRETCRPINSETEARIFKGAAEALPGAAALVISDYGKGVCTARLLSETIAAARRLGVPVFVDPTRTDDYARYRGADMITPNRAEAELVSRRKIVTPEDALAAATSICETNGFGATLIKLDRDGIALATADGFAQHFPTRPREVYDVTGAGDMVLAVVSLCRAAGMGWDETIKTANIAAGLEVERLGSTPISADELEQAIAREEGRVQNKLVTLDAMAALAASHRRQGRTVVFTNGCFDLLHVGHLTCLSEAAEMGDVLIVALNSDASIRRLKGPGRPVINERDRSALVSALACVDHVLIFDDDTPHNLLRRIRPDILVKGGPYTLDQVIGREVVHSYGGQVRVTSVTHDISTTQLLQSLAAP